MAGFGPSDASLLVVGLAPAAHGGNRTGRMFTGDRSGDVLFAALHAVGLANQPTAVRWATGWPCGVRGSRRRCTVRRRTTHRHRPSATPAAPGCAPSSPCSTPRAVVVLGGFGWQALLPVLASAGWTVPRPRPRFGHGTHVELVGERGRLHLFGSYHVSQQNTFTGRLTPAMLEDVLRAAAETAGLSSLPTAADRGGTTSRYSGRHE